MAIGNKYRALYRKLKLKTIHTYVYSLPDGALIQMAQSHPIEQATHHKPSNFAIINNKLTKARSCYYIRLNDEVAHISWVFSKNLLARQLGFKNNYVIGDCQTFDKYKGRGLYGQTVGYIINNNPEKRFILFIDPNNVASIRGVEKIGLTPIGLYSVKRVLGFAFCIKKYG